MGQMGYLPPTMGAPVWVALMLWASASNRGRSAAAADLGDGLLSLKSRTPEPVKLDPGRVPSRTGRRLLDHTEMHNIQILQDLKEAEMAARAATFTYYPDVEEAQGPPAECLAREA